MVKIDYVLTVTNSYQKSSTAPQYLSTRLSLTGGTGPRLLLPPELALDVQVGDSFAIACDAEYLVYSKAGRQDHLFRVVSVSSVRPVRVVVQDVKDAVVK